MTDVGLYCSRCGVEFVRPHGHAVLCGMCWDESDDAVHDRLPKATEDEEEDYYEEEDGA